MKIYKNIIFLKDEEAEKALKILGKQGITTTIEYLKQWESNIEKDTTKPLYNDYDSIFVDKPYILSWNLQRRYVSLQKIVRS